MSDTQSAPSAHDVAAAHATIARQAATEAARREALAPILRTLTDHPGFGAVLATATAVRDQIGAGELVYASLNAIVIGMEGVAQAAKPAGAL